MKRRSALKGILLFSLGTGIVYSCTDKYQAIKDLNLKYLTPKAGELDLLDGLSRMIVPIQSIPELENHTALPFILNMIDDVYSEPDRKAFQAGYQSFDVTVEGILGKKFSALNDEEKMGFLDRLNKREEGMNGSLQTVFDIVKSESVKYLRTSEFFERKVNYYEMAPGRFRGDVSVSELQNANKI